MAGVWGRVHVGLFVGPAFSGVQRSLKCSRFRSISRSTVVFRRNCSKSVVRIRSNRSFRVPGNCITDVVRSRPCCVLFRCFRKG